jgi:ATP-binding cassette subfamily F protein 2
MPPSASKQKRLAEKAAKAASKGGSTTNGTSTPAQDSVNGGSTPLTSVSAAASREDLTSMAKLQIATDRSAAGVLVSDEKGRDLKIDSYTLSFHGRLLIENAEISLNYGQRYVCAMTWVVFADCNGYRFCLKIRLTRRERFRKGA